MALIQFITIIVNKCCKHPYHIDPTFLFQRLPFLEESLKMVDTSDPFAICSIIDQFSQQPTLKENSSLNR
jgi:hypothetical protein